MANVYNKPIVILGGGAEKPVDNGMIYEGKYRVRYFDIDGSILKIEYVESGGRTTPPDSPNYDPEYLIFAEWNYDIENYIIEQPTDIGAIYDTIDNAAYFFCRFTTTTGLNPSLSINGFTSIDWGDGIINTSRSHTYAKEGDYVIKINGNFTMSNTSDIIGTAYKSGINKIYLSNLLTSLPNYMIYGFTGIITLSLSKNINTVGNHNFENLMALKMLILPKQIEILGESNIYRCYSLENISFSPNFKTIGVYPITDMYGLRSLIFPKNFETLGNAGMSQLRALKELWIPQKTITFQKTADYMQALENVFVASEQVPTATYGIFGSCSNGTIFWVNDDIIEDLKVATNWSNFANRMKPLSWYPSLTNPNA